MKIEKAVCPSCGGSIPFDPDVKSMACPYCGSKLYFDDESLHIVYDNMEQAGYEFEKGRLRAQKEAEERRLFELKQIKKKEKHKGH